MLKAIIFDVGGVLIRTRNRTGREKWARKLGMDAWEFENFIFSGESGRQAQLGQKSYKEHWRWLGEHFELDAATLAAMRRDFFAGDALNESLVDYIQRLRQADYRTGILSNFGDDARHVWTEVYPFIQYFDGIVISAEVGVMKPDPTIYHMAAESVGVDVQEALFIDDFVENVEGAKKVGMQALHYADPDEVLQKLMSMTGVS